MIVRDGPFHQTWCHVCDSSVISVAATPNCSIVSAATVSRHLVLLSGDGRPLWEKPVELDNEAWSTAISADGSLIAAGTANKKPADGKVYVFDRERRPVWSHTVGAPVWSVDLSRDGGVLVFTSWDNSAYRYIRKGGTYKQEGVMQIPEAKGLYGISLSADGQYCAFCAYNLGIVILDNNWQQSSVVSDPTGLYNIAFSRTRGEFAAGMRDGGALILPLSNPDGAHRTGRVAARAACGISVTDDGELLALGSFDGRLYLATRNGETLWSYSTDGEVWSSAMSSDGAKVCIGSGDHSVRMFHSDCNSSAFSEIRLTEATLSCQITHHQATHREMAVARLIELYLQTGLVQYGCDQLAKLLVRSTEEYLIRGHLQRLLELDIAAHPHHYESHFRLGQLLKNTDTYRAAHHYQQAANDPELRSSALANAGECFSELHFPTATSSCFRRAREQHMDADSERVLYALGRSYEDQGRWSEAASHYELLVSWNASYRDTWDRLQKLTSLREPASRQYDWKRVDYTGLTASLLGPDTPRVGEVDRSLLDVIHARTEEILMAPGERLAMESIVDDLVKNESYMRGISGLELEYSLEAFLKYDYSLPEDEVKKFLETVHMLFLLKPLFLEKARIKTSLDIGAATGRYPTLFANFGIRAQGLDREATAIDYAKSKVGDKEWPKFYVGDARKLQFDDNSFDLVTCMMGTFAHIPRVDQPQVLANILRVLRPGGTFVISTWDTECEHLAYLSMYNETQKDLIRKNTPLQSEMSELLVQAAAVGAVIRGFCLLPQSIVYDLGLQRLSERDLQMAVHVDLAARAMFPDKHGEMYLAVGKKPPRATEQCPNGDGISLPLAEVIRQHTKDEVTE